MKAEFFQNSGWPWVREVAHAWMFLMACPSLPVQSLALLEMGDLMPMEFKSAGDLPAASRASHGGMVQVGRKPGRSLVAIHSIAIPGDQP